MDDTVKPCPLCEGGAAYDSMRGAMSCDLCVFIGPDCLEHQEAIEAWNDLPRHALAALAEARAAVAGLQAENRALEREVSRLRALVPDEMVAVEADAGCWGQLVEDEMMEACDD